MTQEFVLLLDNCSDINQRFHRHIFSKIANMRKNFACSTHNADLETKYKHHTLFILMVGKYDLSRSRQAKADKTKYSHFKLMS